jgi:uncharacterized membrane protein YiaA
MENQQSQMNAGKKTGGVSWAVVIIVLIVFWPVGIYLLWRKLSGDKKSAMSGGKVVFVIGWILFALGVVMVIVGPSDPTMAVSGRIEYFIVFVCGGLAMILLGGRSKKQAERYKKYISIVINQNITSINNIAAAMPVTYEIAAKDLQKMIDRGYFSGAYIDANACEIVLPKNQGNVQGDQPPYEAAGPATVRMQVAVCKNCGANNQIPAGTIGECEYCGSPLGSN